MFLISLAKSLPRLASMTAFLCLVVAHFEWPLTCSPRWRSSTAFAAGPQSSSVNVQARSLRRPSSTTGADGGTGRTQLLGAGCPHQLHEEGVHPRVPGQLGVEAGGHQAALAH